MVAFVVFTRAIGSLMGVAMAGAIVTAGLRSLPQNLQIDVDGIARIGALPEIERSTIVSVFSTGISRSFMLGGVLTGISLLIILVVQRTKFRAAGSV